MTLNPTLKLSDSTPVGAKPERYIGYSHPTAPVASSGCFDPTHPRDVHHAPSESFMSSILSRPLPAQIRWRWFWGPKPSKPVCPWALLAHEPVHLGAFRSSRRSLLLSQVGDGFTPKPPKRLPPIAVHPDWTPRPRRSSARLPPSVYLSRTPASTTAGRIPSSGWPLFRGLHLHSPPSSGWRAFRWQSLII